MLWDAVYPHRPPDRALTDGGAIGAGTVQLRMLHTPGHSPRRDLALRPRDEPRTGHRRRPGRTRRVIAVVDSPDLIGAVHRRHARDGHGRVAGRPLSSHKTPSRRTDAPIMRRLDCALERQGGWFGLREASRESPFLLVRERVPVTRPRRAKARSGQWSGARGCARTRGEAARWPWHRGGAHSGSSHTSVGGWVHVVYPSLVMSTS